MFPVCPLCCFIVIPMDLVSEINDDDDDDNAWHVYKLHYKLQFITDSVDSTVHVVQKSKHIDAYTVL